MVDPEISTREHAGEFDALETAKPDEPLFVIQGGDPLGPATVLHWVSLARAAASKIRKTAKREDLLRRATNAESVAWKMQDYAAGIQPVPEQSPATVEVVKTAQDDLRAARIKAVSRITNSIAELSETQAALSAENYRVGYLELAIENLQKAAGICEPRTANERT